MPIHSIFTERAHFHVFQFFIQFCFGRFGLFLCETHTNHVIKCCWLLLLVHFFFSFLFRFFFSRMYYINIVITFRYWPKYAQINEVWRWAHCMPLHAIAFIFIRINLVHTIFRFILKSKNFSPVKQPSLRRPMITTIIL